MALTAAQITSLTKKQEKEVITPEGDITYLDTIELSAQSPALSGLAKSLGKTKTGNYRMVMTTKDGHFKFYSNEELTDGPIVNHSFGIQQLADGKTLYWY